MGHYKTFLLGIGVAFGIYFITRKDENGVSILDELLDHPRDVMNNAKDYAIEQLIEKVEDKLT